MEATQPRPRFATDLRTSINEGHNAIMPHSLKSTSNLLTLDRIMRKFLSRLQSLDAWTVFFILVGLFCLSFAASIVLDPQALSREWWADWLQNISLQMLEAILLLGLLQLMIGVGTEKKQLLTQIRTKDKTTVKSAIDRLRAKDWLQDGTLTGASLFEAQFDDVNLSQAKLTGVNFFEASLAGANLLGADLEASYLHYANLANADLREANLRGAHLDYANLLGAKLENARFSSETVLPDGHLWAEDDDLARFTDEKHPQVWRGYDLAGKDLSKADFVKANLAGTDFGESNLSHANLADANLQGAHLHHVNLANANLARVNLQGANLNSTNLSEANLREANLELANLKGANLFKANLEKANTRNAQFDENTVLPDGSKWSASADTKMSFFVMVRFTSPDHPQFWRSDDPQSPAYRKS